MILPLLLSTNQTEVSLMLNNGEIQSAVLIETLTPGTVISPKSQVILSVSLKQGPLTITGVPPSSLPLLGDINTIK